MSNTMNEPAGSVNFRDFSLSAPILEALDKIGYEKPSPIQAAAMPHLLEGRDMLGQAQTGTGKTAAFALPILSRIDLNQRSPQVLVLAPTRELAIQVAEAFERYAANINNFRVLPIYGGQEYGSQIRALKRGVHVVVGTPGRVMDHMRRGTLDLGELRTLVLDEADEMLRMGFIDDVEWILEQTPSDRQIALFSATMPREIKRIAQHHLDNPEEVAIKVKTATAETIRQRYWTVNGLNKLDALTRILEAEEYEGVIIFVRTKNATVDLADQLEARGYAAAALNGDIAQAQRERTVDQLKSGKLDILVATDVVARGLDVERITHVVNYDIPYDTESYVHRIGRTGRAGRKGEAILFVAPRERRLLAGIERATRQKIEQMELPSTDMLNEKRIAKFFDRITNVIEDGHVDFFLDLLKKYQAETNADPLTIAAALAKLNQGKQPLLLREVTIKPMKQDKPQRNAKNSAPRSRSRQPEQGMERYRIEVGRDHNVKPGNIVGAIANEAGLDNNKIGRIDIFDQYSTVDLPEGMPREIFSTLKRVWVANRQLNISRMHQSQGAPSRGRPNSDKGQDRKKSKRKFKH